MQCSGGTAAVTVAVDKLLRGFKPGFKGVVWDDACDMPGCLLTFCGLTRAVVADSSISGINSRHVDVVVCAAGSAELTLQRSNVTHNNATAMAAFNQSRVVVSVSRLAYNVGHKYNGGAVVDGNATLDITEYSMVVGNVANNRSGAGVRVRGHARATITGQSQILNNTSDISGGGVAVFDDGKLVVDGGSCVCNNTGSWGGGLLATERARVTIMGASRVEFNSASDGTGGGVFVNANASLSVTGDSSISKNTALFGGGGVAMHDQAVATIRDTSTVCDNSCGQREGGGDDGGEEGAEERCDGGGVLVHGDARLDITGCSSVCNNSASGHGGGVAMFNQTHVTISGTSKVCHNSCGDGDSPSGSGRGGGVVVADFAQLTVSEGSSVCYNRGAGGGGLFVQDSAQLTITGSSTVFNNTSETASGGGVSVGDEARLNISGGSSVCKNWAGSSAGGLYFTDTSTARITNATICNNTCEGYNANGGAGLVIDADAAVYVVSAQLIGNWVEYSSGGAVVLRDGGNLTLGPGVVLANNSVGVGYVGANIAAYDRSFLFMDSDVTGDDLPLTKCNRSVYLGRMPCQEGEYQGSGLCQCCPEYQYGFEENALACKPCPDNAHCPGGTVVLPNPGYYHSADRSVQMHACPIASSCQGNGTCAPGYKGNLCGACAKGWGQTLALRCGKCMAPAQQFGVYAAVVCVTVVLISLTVRFTWQDNKAGDRAVRPSDLCKVLAQFLQYLVILGSISVRWPKFLTWVFATATVVFGGASGQALSFDCWLAHYVPQTQLPVAIQRQLALFVVAAGILLAVMLLMSCVHIFKQVAKGRKRGEVFHLRATQLWRKLRVAVLVVAFYAYPTLVKASLSFFACLRIDDGSKQPYPEYSVLNHPLGYWVQDIQQQCFAGWHRPWALGFGIPAVALLCLFVPIGLWLFLSVNRNSIADVGFREHYGFLYRNYTDRRVWWEAVWAAQTVLLTAVSVFHFMLQAYYALFAMCLVLLLSAGLQLIARPYAQKELHRLHLTSTWCLFFNVWLSIALFDDAVEAREETLRPLHTTIGVVLVVINSCFIIWCMYKIVKAVAPTVVQMVMAAPTKAQRVWEDLHGVVGSTASSRLRVTRLKFKQRNRRNAQQEVSSASVDV
jgi:hypothetical protein